MNPRICRRLCPKHLKECGSIRPEHEMHFHGSAKAGDLCIYSAGLAVRKGTFDPNAHIAPEIMLREVVRAF